MKSRHQCCDSLEACQHIDLDEEMLCDCQAQRGVHIPLRELTTNFSEIKKSLTGNLMKKGPCYLFNKGAVFFFFVKRKKSRHYFSTRILIAAHNKLPLICGTVNHTLGDFGGLVLKDNTGAVSLNMSGYVTVPSNLSRSIYLFYHS